jgi:MFS family permease
MDIRGKFSPGRQLALQSSFLVANAFIWYFFAANALQDNINKITTDFFIVQIIWAFHFGALIISLIISPILAKKVGRRRLFVIWTLLGVLSPITLLTLNFASAPLALIVGALLAVSAGLGMPNCMEYFTTSTNTSSRGRYAGLILLLSGLGLFGLRLLGGGILLTAVILIGWRLLGLLGLFAFKPFKGYKEKSSLSYRTAISHRSFVLYVIPWAMFSLVNYLSIPVQSTILGEVTRNNLQIIENAIGGISAIAAGFLMDYVGRKQAAIAGFTLLGVSYAILGLYPNDIVSWYFYTVFDGITWGILSILFVITIWGELSHNSSSDKYYAIGVVPFFVSKFLQQSLGNSIATDILPYTLFSFTAFFLFLAVLPLVYAPETLPEKTVKDRDLKSYIEKAKKAVAKEEQKKQKEKESPQKSPPEESEQSKEYEEARKLAEKYY